MHLPLRRTRVRPESRFGRKGNLYNTKTAKCTACSPSLLCSVRQAIQTKRQNGSSLSLFYCPVPQELLPTKYPDRRNAEQRNLAENCTAYGCRHRVLKALGGRVALPTFKTLKLFSMEYRRMGKTGLQLSVLSFGSWVTFHKQISDRGTQRNQYQWK